MLSQDLNVDVKFRENIETAGIVSTNNIGLTYEVADTVKNYLTVNGTNVSSAGVTYQTSSLSKYVQADNWLMETKFKVVLAGQTFKPSKGTAANSFQITPPFLAWPGINMGVTPGCLNKSISQLTFNISGSQFIEAVRQDPEIVDMWLSQMDLKKMEADGMAGVLESENLGLLRWLYGNGQVSRYDVFQASPITYAAPYSASSGLTQIPSFGFESSLSPKGDNPHAWARQYQNGYITVDSVQYFTNSTPTESGATAVAGTIIFPDGEYGPGVQVPSADGSTPFYSISPIVSGSPDTGNTPTVGGQPWLIQTLNITIHEYLISNSISCSRWSKNPNSRAFPTAGQLLTMQAYFNSQFLNSMIKICPVMMGTGGFPGGNPAPIPSKNSVVVSVTPTASNLSFITFDTKKKIDTDMRLLYYNLNKQTVPPPAVIDPGTSLTNPIKTQCLSSVRTSLDNYMYLCFSSKLFNNLQTYVQNVQLGQTANATGGANQLASILAHTITSLTIQYGTDVDALLGTNVPIREAIQLTMDTIGNPELKKFISNQYHPKTTRSLFDTSDTKTLWTTGSYVAGLSGEELDVFFYRQNFLPSGYVFLLLPLDKLNWHPIFQDDPVLCNMNYSSSNYKSFNVTVNWTPNAHCFEGLFSGSPTLTVDPLFYLINKWVRTLSVGNTKPMTESPIEFDYIGQSDIRKKLSHFFTDISQPVMVDDELMLVGGSWLGSLWGSVKSALAPVATVVRGINHVSNLASQGLDLVGLGGERGGRPVGRPRKASRRRY